MNTSLHLTDDQIDDALIGDLAQDCAAHLEGCESCQMRLAEAEAPIASFNEVSLAWSERRSATLPAQPVAAARPSMLPKAVWAGTAAAVLAVGITVPVARRYAGGSGEQAENRETVAQTMMASTGSTENPIAAREEQIARDNQMLQSIDRELDAPSSSPALMYGVTHTGSPQASAPIRN